MIQTRIVAAMRISERRWNLRMKNGTDILLPEGHEVEALDRLLVLQQDTALLDRPLQTIDMRLGDRLVLRPLGASPSDKTAPAPPVPKKPT
jgi:cell division protein FtsQ